MFLKIKILLWNILHEILYVYKKRDNSIIVMGGWFGRRFSDTSRVLFQHLSENKERYGLSHVIWVTRKAEIKEELCAMGYEALMMDSSESIEYHKKAGIHIICNSSNYGKEIEGDILPQYSNGALKINLWHGVGGIKGVGFASNKHRQLMINNPFKAKVKETIANSYLYRKYGLYMGGWGDCYYLSPSEYSAELLKCYFGKRMDKKIIAPYPRNYENVALLKEEMKVLEKIKSEQIKIMYLPTFRKNSQMYINPIEDVCFVNALEQNDILWIQKAHGAFEGDKLSDVISKNVVQLESDFDINLLISKVDLVITDYSSVVWDALYYGVPVAFFMPDFEEYKNGDNGFLLTIDDFLVGKALYTMEELTSFVQLGKKEFKNSMNEKAECMKNIVWGAGVGCDKTWQQILKLVK